MYRAEKRRERHAQADLIQAISVGYAGGKPSKNNVSFKTMRDVLKALRE